MGRNAKAPPEGAKFWNERETGYMLAVHPDTLGKWRRKGVEHTPPYSRDARGRVIYEAAKVRAWFDACIVKPQQPPTT